MWIIFIGGFLFFWLIGALIFKEPAAGVLLPIGLIALGFIAAFLVVVWAIIF